MVDATDSKLVGNLRALMLAENAAARNTLGAPITKPALSAPFSLANPTRLSGAGGGIASPLTEQSREESIVTLISNDGLIQVDVAEITRMIMLDRNGSTVEFIFATPE